MDCIEAICTTRAIRRYRDEPIPDHDLATILFAASRAPSGSNRQPFTFVVLRDTERARTAKALLGESFRSLWATKRAADGYDAGSGVEERSPKARMAATMQHFVDTFEQTPVVVLVCARTRYGASLQDGASVYPACQNLLLAARALGYGGVLTMWHAAVADQLAGLLEIPDDITIAATIPLGVPEGDHGPVRRRPLDELVFEDRWGGPAAWALEPEGTRHTGSGPRRDAGTTTGSDAS